VHFGTFSGKMSISEISLMTSSHHGAGRFGAGRYGAGRFGAGAVCGGGGNVTQGYNRQFESQPLSDL